MEELMTIESKELEFINEKFQLISDEIKILNSLSKSNNLEAMIGVLNLIRNRSELIVRGCYKLNNNEVTSHVVNCSICTKLEYIGKRLNNEYKDDFDFLTRILPVLKLKNITLEKIKSSELLNVSK
jgi:hypothetical protein